MRLNAVQSSNVPRRRQDVPAVRVRPGEAPVWVEVSVPATTARRWRRDAEAAGLGVDAWASLLVERQVLVDELPAGAISASFAHALADGLSRLAPTDELRRWARALGGADDVSWAPDEMPAIVLPARTIARLPASDRARYVVDAVEGGDIAEALTLERAATLYGMTMEVYVLHVVARALTSGV